MNEHFNIRKLERGHVSIGIKIGYSVFSGFYISIGLFKIEICLNTRNYKKNLKRYMNKRFGIYGENVNDGVKDGISRMLGGDFDGDKVTMNIPHDDILSNIKPYSKKEE